MEKSCCTPLPRNTKVSGAQAINVATGLVEQQEERLRDILESRQSTPDEKFEALVDLAHLAGILLHEMSEAEETHKATKPDDDKPGHRVGSRRSAKADDEVL
jgi:hypothetical protein